MKKIKLLTPIMGIVAGVSTLVPLAGLTSCGQTAKITLTKGNKDITLFANSKVAYYFFKTSDITDINKTRASLTNLKISGADANPVDGLVYTTYDAAGNIRITIDVETIINHYSKPSSIEFSIVIQNKSTKVSQQFDGFKISINQDEEADIFLSEGTIIKGFNTELTQVVIESLSDIFVPNLDGEIKMMQNLDFGVKGNAQKYEDTYTLSIPSKYTEIDVAALAKKLPECVTRVSFAKDLTTRRQNMVNIASNAFAENKYLKEVILPDSLQNIGDAAFFKCTNLSNVIFPTEKNHDPLFTTFPSSLFEDCTSLKSLTLPTYITTMGTYPFANTGLTIIDVSSWYDISKISAKLLLELINFLEGQGVTPTLLAQTISIAKKLVKTLDLKIQPYPLYATKTETNIILSPSTRFIVAMETITKLDQNFSLVFPTQISNTESSKYFNSINNFSELSPSIPQKIYLPEQLEYLTNSSFPSSVDMIREYHLPKTIKQITSDSLQADLIDIYYDGTIEEWEQFLTINKENCAKDGVDPWKPGTAIIHCLDGLITPQQQIETGDRK